MVIFILSTLIGFYGVYYYKTKLDKYLLSVKMSEQETKDKREALDKELSETQEHIKNLDTIIQKEHDKFESYKEGQLVELENFKAKELQDLADNKQQYLLDLVKSKEGELKELESQKETILNFLENHTKFPELFDYDSELKTYQTKIEEVKSDFDVLTELVMFQEVGLYDYDVDLRKYAKDSHIAKIKTKQKELQKGTNFFDIKVSYTVNNDIKQGEKLQKENAKVGLRCFNEESKSILSGAKPENRQTKIKKLDKSFEIINKSIDSVGVSLNKKLLTTKKELLDIEIAKYVKKEEEKELLRIKKEQEREQKLVEAEAKKELAKIAKEEEHLKNELERLEKDSNLQKEHQEQIDYLKAQIQGLEDKKEEVNENTFKGRAGYVYIIGNKGSLGEDVYKIGVTRRLNPQDRILELGNASVPFRFETHATIFSEDAFGLESSLHKQFDAHRVNRINNRKEFFKVPLSEIKQAVLDYDNTVEFDMEALDIDYLQTLKLLEQETK